MEQDAGPGRPTFSWARNQYAALGAWKTQLTDQKVASDRPVNLYKPADQDIDRGAHGIFDRKARGFFDPRFLESLPTTTRTFAAALGRSAEEKVKTYQAIAAERKTKR
jgi:hypothetical protein